MKKFYCFILIFLNTNLFGQVIYKSEGSSKQVNVNQNLGNINVNSVINLEGKLYDDLIARQINFLGKRTKTIQKINLYPDDADFKNDLIEINRDIEKINAEIENYKSSFYRLNEIFSKIEINSERIKLAKAFFDEGKILEADVILKAEDLANDQAKLLNAKEQKEKELESIKLQLSNNAAEYYIKAQITSLRYDLPNRFQLTCEYYEQSLRAARNDKVLFNYANFLYHHNQHDKAMLYFKEILQTYRTLAKTNPEIYLSYVATTLNNLGILQMDKNDYTNAELSYNEALQIKRTLAKTNPENYLPDFAATLYNLGILQSYKNDYTNAKLSYAEVLQTYRTLAKSNPESYLPYVAGVLNNLGILEKNKKDYTNALSSYNEALQIKRTLAKTNPEIYLPAVALSLINLSDFYIQSIVSKEKSLALIEEAIEILVPFSSIGKIQNYIKGAFKILRNWEINPEIYLKENFPNNPELLDLL